MEYKIGYEIEAKDNSYNIVFIDEDNEIKDLVAVAFSFIHAKLIQHTLNEYHNRISKTELVEEV